MDAEKEELVMPDRRKENSDNDDEGEDILSCGSIGDILAKDDDHGDRVDDADDFYDTAERIYRSEDEAMGLFGILHQQGCEEQPCLNEANQDDESVYEPFTWRLCGFIHRKGQHRMHEDGKGDTDADEYIKAVRNLF